MSSSARSESRSSLRLKVRSCMVMGGPSCGSGVPVSHISLCSCSSSHSSSFPKPCSSSSLRPHSCPSPWDSWGQTHHLHRYRGECFIECHTQSDVAGRVVFHIYILKVELTSQQHQFTCYMFKFQFRPSYRIHNTVL